MFTFKPFLGAIGLAVSCSTSMAATSTFTNGSEGWSAQGDTQGSLTWASSGGSPGGHVQISDATTGGVTYFVAPVTFLGNFAAAAGSNLTFDLQQVFSGSANQFNNSDVVLQGGGLTIAYDTLVNPANGAWTSYSVPLAATGWRLNDLSGAQISSEQFTSVLSSLTSLKIRAEYQTGADIGKLDNVALVPEASTYSMAIAAICLVLLNRQRKIV
jgi:Laminin B (Domain IV)